jgi:predicted alpha/beta hydrolase
MKIKTADGFELAFGFFSNEKPKGAILIVPAMGVPQSYYRPFAEWLAEEGYAAATFDYRGMGESRGDGFRHSLRGFQADILDWARLDTAAALDALASRASGVPLYWIGHSLGGQIIPFVPGHEKLAKAITVAAGSGYWRYNSPGLRWRAWFLWYCLAPLSLAFTGYFAGAKLGVVGDLPAGVIRQWRRWCLQPEYAVGDGDAVRAQYAAVRAPIASLSFPDDEFMSARSIESLHAFYSSSRRELKRIAPQDIGVRRIGHFGFFRSEFKESLWRRHLLPALA